MLKNKKYKIQVYKQTKIGETANQLIEDVFGITGALLTNKSTLDDFFLDLDFPGHRMVPFSEIPEQEKYKYDVSSFEYLGDKCYVYYPPITDEESEVIHKITRKLLIKRVEEIYGISLKDYPESEELYVWKVAKLIVSNLNRAN